MTNGGVSLVCCLALWAVGGGPDDQSASASVYAMSLGRLGAVVAALVGLTGVVIGVRALVRSRRTGNGLSGGTVALVAGLIGMVLGGLVVTTAGGGLGTGNGLGGGIVALVVGLISTVLGGLARTRSRRGAGHFYPIPAPPPPAE